MPSDLRSWTLGGLAALSLFVAAAPAVAHSFLATTRPAQGERLASPPRDVALQLSEPVEVGTARVEVTDGEGVPVDVGRLEFEADGAVVRVPLVSPDEGLYRVSWHVVSAVDGHESAGEFAFAVGDEASLRDPAAGAGGDTDVPWYVTAATWLLLTGWSLAFGAVVLARRAAGRGFPGRPATWIRIGTLAALLGLAVRMGAPSGDRATTAAVAAAVTLAAGLALASTRASWPSLILLGSFAVVWPARGHAATTFLGWVLDSVHLLAAGIWAGGLSVIVVAFATAARVGRGRDALPLARVYAGTAFWAVIALAATGTALGWSLVLSVDSLLSESYGRLLLLKALLLLMAAAAAVVARRRMAAAEVGGLRRMVRPEHASLVVALLAAAILVDTPPRPPTVETLLGPPPIEGPVSRVAGMAGQITLDVQAGDGRLDVYARGPSGGIDADVELAALMPDGTGLELHPRPCGIGCSTLSLQLPPGVTRLAATADAEGWPGGTTSLELRWPPPVQSPALFDRMRQAMLAAERVLVAEEAGAYPPPGAAGTPLSGAQLVELMPWAGGGVTDVRPVPGDPGRFTFYLPGSFMWFDVTVDDRDRLVTQRLVNPGHDIRYRFRYPDPGPAASPDTSTTSP